MQFGISSNFTGDFSQSGLIEINITSGPSRQITLSYSNSESIFKTSSCIDCNDTHLTIKGITLYFQKVTFILEGKYNNTVYARSNIDIYYSCFIILGCRICNKSINAQNQSEFKCLKCFTAQQSQFYLLY
jgi:hypothetical protein